MIIRLDIYQHKKLLMIDRVFHLSIFLMLPILSLIALFFAARFRSLLAA